MVILKNDSYLCESNNSTAMRTKIFIAFIFLTNITIAQNDGWNISTTNNTNYTGIVIANGRLGILPSEEPFRTKQIILNNVYEKASQLGVSRILEGMNFGNLDVYIDDELVAKNTITNWKQNLNMKDGSFKTSFLFKNKAQIAYTYYAIRNVPFSSYIDIKIEAKQDVKVKVIGKIESNETYQNPISTYRVLQDLETTMPILQTVAQSEFGRHTVATSATFIWHNINSTREHQRPALVHNKISDYNNQLSFEKIIKKNTSLEFAWTAAECTTQDFADPQNESERFVIFNLLTPKID